MSTDHHLREVSYQLLAERGGFFRSYCRAGAFFAE